MNVSWFLSLTGNWSFQESAGSLRSSDSSSCISSWSLSTESSANGAGEVSSIWTLLGWGRDGVDLHSPDPDGVMGDDSKNLEAFCVASSCLVRSATCLDSASNFGSSEDGARSVMVGLTGVLTGA